MAAGVMLMVVLFGTAGVAASGACSKLAVERSLLTYTLTRASGIDGSGI